MEFAADISTHMAAQGMAKGTLSDEINTITRLAILLEKLRFCD